MCVLHLLALRYPQITYDDTEVKTRELNTIGIPWANAHVVV